MVPSTEGREVRRLPWRLSSVREVMSHTARGKSDRALLERLRLLNLQNLDEGGGGVRERASEGVNW